MKSSDYFRLDYRKNTRMKKIIAYMTSKRSFNLRWNVTFILLPDVTWTIQELHENNDWWFVRDVLVRY